MKTNFEKESHFENVSSFRNPFLNENMFLEKWSDPIKHIQGVSTSEMNIDGDLDFNLLVPVQDLRSKNSV